CDDFRPRKGACQGGVEFGVEGLVDHKMGKRLDADIGRLRACEQADPVGAALPGACDRVHGLTGEPPSNTWGVVNRLSFEARFVSSSHRFFLPQTSIERRLHFSNSLRSPACEGRRLSWRPLRGNGRFPSDRLHCPGGTEGGKSLEPMA